MDRDKIPTVNITLERIKVEIRTGPKTLPVYPTPKMIHVRHVMSDGAKKMIREWVRGHKGK